MKRVVILSERASEGLEAKYLKMYADQGNL